MVLQSLIFIFSIIFVIWGAYEVYLDKTFNEMDRLFAEFTDYLMCVTCIMFLLCVALVCCVLFAFERVSVRCMFLYVC